METTNHWLPLKATYKVKHFFINPFNSPRPLIFIQSYRAQNHLTINLFNPGANTGFGASPKPGFIGPRAPGLRAQGCRAYFGHHEFFSVSHLPFRSLSTLIVLEARTFTIPSVSIIALFDSVDPDVLTWSLRPAWLAHRIDSAISFPNSLCRRCGLCFSQPKQPLVCCDDLSQMITIHLNSTVLAGAADGVETSGCPRSGSLKPNNLVATQNRECLHRFGTGDKAPITSSRGLRSCHISRGQRAWPSADCSLSSHVGHMLDSRHAAPPRWSGELGLRPVGSALATGASAASWDLTSILVGFVYSTVWFRLHPKFKQETAAKQPLEGVGSRRSSGGNTLGCLSNSSGFCPSHHFIDIITSIVKRSRARYCDRLISPLYGSTPPQSSSLSRSRTPLGGVNLSDFLRS
ncbi:hypothetical protein J6590_076437 [Homalodisca vitripennis]|nr:hypothetical protein J6590_076437 [Homalodisca vitripennis]